MPLHPDDPRHGTPGAYGYWKCRCTTCRTANATRIKTIHDRLHVTGLPPGDPRHGTINGYGNYGCRCEPCRTAHSTYQTDYRKKTRTPQ